MSKTWRQKIVAAAGIAVALLGVPTAGPNDPILGAAHAGKNGAVRSAVRHQAHRLARTDRHLRRDIHRDKRQDRHVEARIHDLRKFLHGSRGTHQGAARSAVRHKVHQLARTDRHLDRDVRRDKRHEKHVHENLTDLRDYLHRTRKKK